jgi:hypothetical protein
VQVKNCSGGALMFEEQPRRNNRGRTPLAEQPPVVILSEAKDLFAP